MMGRGKNRKKGGVSFQPPPSLPPLRFAPGQRQQGRWRRPHPEIRAATQVNAPGRGRRELRATAFQGQTQREGGGTKTKEGQGGFSPFHPAMCPWSTGPPLLTRPQRKRRGAAAPCEPQSSSAQAPRLQPQAGGGQAGGGAVGQGFKHMVSNARGEFCGGGAFPSPARALCANGPRTLPRTSLRRPRPSERAPRRRRDARLAEGRAGKQKAGDGETKGKRIEEALHPRQSNQGFFSLDAFAAPCCAAGASLAPMAQPPARCISRRGKTQ